MKGKSCKSLMPTCL